MDVDRFRWMRLTFLTLRPTTMPVHRMALGTYFWTLYLLCCTKSEVIEKCLGSLYTVDMLQSSLYPLKQKRLILE